MTKEELIAKLEDMEARIAQLEAGKDEGSEDAEDVKEDEESEDYLGALLA